MIVNDEFSMLDYYYLFRIAEGLCRKFAKHRLPWGGRNVVMLGDPAQLPAVGRSGCLAPSLAYLSSFGP